MILKKLDRKMFDKYRDDIEKLLYRVYTINFPENRSLSKIINQKIIDIPKYIEDGSAYITVGIENEEMVLFMWAYPVDEEEMHLTQIVVKEEYEGKGYATNALMNLQEEVCRRQMQRISLNAMFDNKRAITFYERMGYEIVRVHMQKVNVE